MAVKVVSFEGTNTKNTYVVGKSYSMNGETYKANADGSFTNNSSGQKLVGSSQSATAVFNVSGGSAGGKEQGKAVVVKAAVPAKGTVGSPGYVPAKPAVLAITSAGTGPGTVGVGVPVVAPVVSGAKPNLVKTVASDLFLWGATIRPNPNTSDMQYSENRYGEAEFLNPTWFMQWGVAIADIEPTVAAHDWNKIGARDVVTNIADGFDTWLKEPGPAKQQRSNGSVTLGPGAVAGVVGERYGYGWPI